MGSVTESPLIYHQKSGKLFYNHNEQKRGWSRAGTGGLFLKLPAKTDIGKIKIRTQGTSANCNLGGNKTSKTDVNVLAKLEASIKSRVLLEDIITGTWKSARKNKPNSDDIFSTKFKIDEFRKPLKINSISDSILGDYENPRTVGSGNLKLDYYNNSTKIAEVSIFSNYIDEFFAYKKLGGQLRINREKDSMILVEGFDGNFDVDKIPHVDFEVDI